MQLYPRKSGEMQIQAGGGSGILLGDCCAPLRLAMTLIYCGRGPRQIMQEHAKIRTLASSAQQTLCLWLAAFALLHIHHIKKSRMMPRNVVLTKVTRPPGTLTVERTSTRIKQHGCHCRLDSPLHNQVNTLKQKKPFLLKNKNKTIQLKSNLGDKLT